MIEDIQKLCARRETPAALVVSVPMGYGYYGAALPTTSTMKAPPNLH